MYTTDQGKQPKLCYPIKVVFSFYSLLFLLSFSNQIWQLEPVWTGGVCQGHLLNSNRPPAFVSTSAEESTIDIDY